MTDRDFQHALEDELKSLGFTIHLSMMMLKGVCPQANFRTGLKIGHVLLCVNNECVIIQKNHHPQMMIELSRPDAIEETIKMIKVLNGYK